MFCWLLIILFVVLIFSAHKLPALKGDLMEAAKKGKEKAEAKLAEVKKNRENKKQD